MKLSRAAMQDSAEEAALGRWAAEAITEVRRRDRPFCVSLICSKHFVSGIGSEDLTVQRLEDNLQRLRRD